MTLTEARRTLETDKVLTPTETKIASGYTCGLIGKEIADKCGISPLTVVRHTQNIYEKTGIPHSTNALVAWFLSTNFKIDLKEFWRKLGAFILFLLACIEIATTDFDSPYLKRLKTRRSAACKVWGRPRSRRGDDRTYHFPNR